MYTKEQIFMGVKYGLNVTAIFLLKNNNWGGVAENPLGFFQTSMQKGILKQR